MGGRERRDEQTGGNQPTLATGCPGAPCLVAVLVVGSIVASCGGDDGPRCRNDDDCPTGLICSEARECRQPCNDDTDCLGDLVCAEGLCAEGNGPIDECATGTHDCHADATCADTSTAYTCTCDPGYEGDGRLCQDVDECLRQADDCDDAAECINEPGTFSCRCPFGFVGDGRSCEPGLDLDLTSPPLPASMCFSRASSATVIGADGVMRTAAIDEPRFDHALDSGDARGLLIEPQRTNMLLHSAALDQAPWEDHWTGPAALVTAAGLAPDGTMTAARLSGTSGRTQSAELGYLEVGTKVSFSIYVKPVEDADLTLAVWRNRTNDGCNCGGGGTSGWSIPAGTWTRVVAWETIRTAGNVTFAGGVIEPRGAIYIWGGQIEVGGLSSYIPTTDAPATRAADVPCTLEGTWLASDRGTLTMDLGLGSLTGGRRFLWTLSDGTADNRMGLYAVPDTAAIAANIVAGGVEQLDTPLATFSGWRHRAALIYGLDRVTLVIDGASSTTTGSPIVPVQRLSIGTDEGGQSQLGGWIRSLRYERAERPTAELELSTSVFSIRGITGGSDENIDDVLGDGIVPTVHWQDAGGEASYDIRVADAQTQTEVCSFAAAADATSEALTDCLLVEDQHYTVSIDAVGASGQRLAALNDGFEFSLLPIVEFSSGSQAVTEAAGAAQVEIRASRTTAGPIRVWLRAPYSTATFPEDHDFIDQWVTIPAGELTATVSLTIQRDAIFEDSEEIGIWLSSPSGAAIGPGNRHTITVVDSDPATNGPDLLLELTAPPLDSQITFRRASTGTYFDDTGTLVAAAIDEPRFDHDPKTGAPLGLLLEGPTTNLLLDSEDVTTASWVNGADVPVVTSGGGPAPDGISTARIITAGAREQTVAPGGALAGRSFVFSTFVRAAAPGGAALATLALREVAAGGCADSASSVVEVDERWQRISVWVDACGAGSTELTVGIHGVDGVAVWGAQLEEGQLSSYVPTGATTADRAADLPSMTDVTWYSLGSGLLFVELDTAMCPGCTQAVVEIGDGTAANQLLLTGDNVASSSAATITRNGYGSYADAVGGWGAGLHRVALGYGSVNTFVVDGTSSTDETLVNGPTATLMRIGHASDLTRYLYGHVRRVAYWSGNRDPQHARFVGSRFAIDGIANATDPVRDAYLSSGTTMVVYWSPLPEAYSIRTTIEDLAENPICPPVDHLPSTSYLLTNTCGVTRGAHYVLSATARNPALGVDLAADNSPFVFGAVPLAAFDALEQSVSEGAGTVTLTVELTEPVTVDTQLPYTVTGTATPTVDHDQSDGFVFILGGYSSGSLAVTIASDGDVEGDETVIITLRPEHLGPWATTSGGTHTLTIVDDD